VGPQRGQKAFTLQTLAPTPVDEKAVDNVARTGGLSLHVGIAAKVHQREKLERLCRYIARPAVVTVRLSLTRQGDIRVALKTPYRERRLNQARAVPCDGIATIPFVRRAPRGGLSRTSRRKGPRFGGNSSPGTTVPLGASRISPGPTYLGYALQNGPMSAKRSRGAKGTKTRLRTSSNCGKRPASSSTRMPFSNRS